MKLFAGKNRFFRQTVGNNVVDDVEEDFTLTDITLISSRSTIFIFLFNVCGRRRRKRSMPARKFSHSHSHRVSCLPFGRGERRSADECVPIARL